MANGGPFDCYPPGWFHPPRLQPARTSDPVWQPPQTSSQPNYMEQMGIDPISKLATAIEKLADALNGEGVRE